MKQALSIAIAAMTLGAQIAPAPPASKKAETAAVEAAARAYYQAVAAEDGPALEQLLSAPNEDELYRLLLAYQVVFDTTKTGVTSIKIVAAEIFGQHAAVRTRVECRVSNQEETDSYEGGGDFVVILINTGAGWKVRKVTRAAAYDANIKSLVFEKALRALENAEPALEEPGTLPESAQPASGVRPADAD